MEIYRAKIKYDKNTIFKLAKTISKTYRLPLRIIAYFCGFAMIVCSLFIPMGATNSLTLLVVGCLLITGIDAPARHRAQVSFNSVGKREIVGKYSFLGNSFTLTADEHITEMEYDKIVRLVEDDEYLYIFTDKNSAFMLEKSSVKPHSSKDLMRFLADKTGQKWHGVFSLFSFRLSLFRQRSK